MSQQLIHTGRSLVFVSSFLLTFFLASWVNSQGIAELAEKEKIKIIEGAKKEGQLVYYTGMNLDQATVFTQEFVKKYPFIKPEIFRSSGEKVLTKYLTEARAKTYKADVFQASVIQVFQLKEQGLLQRYVSPETPTRRALKIPTAIGMPSICFLTSSVTTRTLFLLERLRRAMRTF